MAAVRSDPYHNAVLDPNNWKKSEMRFVCEFRAKLGDRHCGADAHWMKRMPEQTTSYGFLCEAHYFQLADPVPDDFNI